MWAPAPSFLPSPARQQASGAAVVRVAPRPPLHQGASSLGVSSLLGTLGATAQRVGAKLGEQECLLAKGPLAHGVGSNEVFHPDCAPQRVGIKSSL